MNKYVSIKIDGKDCKGISLYCDTNKKSITSSVEANKLISIEYKLQLRTKVNNINGKKIFTFNKDKKTFLKALEFVASERANNKNMISTNGTVREVKQEVQIKEDASISFLDKIELFLETKSISTRPSTVSNYSTA